MYKTFETTRANKKKNKKKNPHRDLLRVGDNLIAGLSLNLLFGSSAYIYSSHRRLGLGYTSIEFVEGTDCQISLRQILSYRNFTLQHGKNKIKPRNAQKCILFRTNT